MKTPALHPVMPYVALCAMTLAAPGLAAEPLKVPDRAQLAAESTRMTSLFHEKAKSQSAARAESFLSLDLSDRVHYDFVLHRLLAAGNTPGNSPRLFEALEKARQLALQGPGARTSPECSQLITLNDTPVAGTVEYRSSALVSCFGNDGYLFSDLTAFQADAEHVNTRVLDRRASEQYGTHVGGTDEASLRLTYAYQEDRLLQFDSLVLAFEPHSGAALASYATVATSGYSFAPEKMLANPSTDVFHPTNLIDAPGENVLRICLERGSAVGNVDCDYGSVVQHPGGLSLYPYANDWSRLPDGVAGVHANNSRASGTWMANTLAYFLPDPAPYDPARTYVPLQGYYDAGDTAAGTCVINSYVPGSTTAKLYMVNNDPSCNIPPNTLLGIVNLTESNAELRTGQRTSPFRKTLDYGPICVGYEKTTKLVLSIGAKATCGASTNVVRYKTTTVDSIQFRNSCFASGTQVTRANGTQADIAQIQIGDKVLANSQGLALTVTTLSRGQERSAMVRVKDDQGQQALITQTHPVMTVDRGAVRAENLKVGDRLITQKGPATLVSVGREKYEGPVYNLAVGTVDELRSLSPEQRTLFASGILMGDYRMQTELDDTRSKSSPAQVSIPSAWVVDYAHDLKRP